MHAKESQLSLKYFRKDWMSKITQYKAYNTHGSLRNMHFSLFFLQLIQTISAVDKDDPLGGQKFFFSLAAVNPNFTVQDNEGKLQNVMCSL